MTLKEIGALFKSTREEQGKTQEEIGVKAGKSQQHIYKLESGANATLQTLVAVAKALGYRLKVSLEKKPK